MIGKRFRSKINGKIFLVTGLKTEGKNQYYTIQEEKTGYTTTIGKGWFENGYIWNLEEVLDN